MHPKSSRKKNIYQQWLIDRFSSERLTKEVYFVTSINKKADFAVRFCQIMKKFC